MYRKQISIWLLTCSLMIILMVAIGGLTRLTGSGLSITSWKPISGVVPPLSDQAWTDEFSAYQQSPQFKAINSSMSLEDFKGIFWLEFIHRLIGRAIGLIFFIPLVWFLWTKQITSKFGLILFGLFSLGGVQGVIGWYMVKSGLKDAPYVNHGWLAFHLVFAAMIMAGILISAFYSMGLTRNNLSTNPKIKLLVRFILALVVIQLILGGLVAGLHAGMIYNSFPLMNGQLVPNDIMFLSPGYSNLFNNATTVQFEHRIVACILFLMIFSFFISMLRSKNLPKILKIAVAVLFVLILVQFLLGISVLLLQVPIGLASFHQILAIIVFAIVVFINYIA